MAAIVIILALVVRLEALEAHVAILAALELRAALRTPLVAAAIRGVLNLATFLPNWEAFSALAAVTEAKAAVAVNLADVVAHATLAADLVVGVAGPRAALPEGTAVVGALLARRHAVTGVAPAEHRVPRVVRFPQVNGVLLSTSYERNGSAENA